MVRVAFEDLPTSDLVVDAIYGGGTLKHHGDDPISKVLPVDNQGGFRWQKAGGPAIALHTLGSDHLWPDALDPRTGIFTFYGDNKRPGREIHVSKGNQILRDAFALTHGSVEDRRSCPVFFAFEKAGLGRDARFLGLAVPGAAGLSESQDLVAVWARVADSRFQNYRATFTILDAPVVRAWIDELAAGERLGEHCPQAYRKWVEAKAYTPLRTREERVVRSKHEQTPAEGTPDRELLDLVYAHFVDDPHVFEKCAVKLWEMLHPGRSGEIQITQRSRDGGFDAYGVMPLGPFDDRLDLPFVIEAKLYAPGGSGLGVSSVFRMIARLRHRMFGVLITTSWLRGDPYREIRDDGHPVIVISGADVARILRAGGLGDRVVLQEWLNQIHTPAA